MKWRCWICEKDVESTREERPRCCNGATFTPMLDTREPSERAPRPGYRGDHEDVVLFMILHHGGQFGARASRPGGPLSIAVWIPPESPEISPSSAHLDMLNTYALALKERS